MSKVVKKVFKGVKKAVKSVGKFVKKHWKTIVLATATVFTAGAALGYIGMGAGGGLAFGAGAGAGGLGGVGTAFGALGNTVASAVGMGTPFGGTVTAKGASVMGMGTGGMNTASGLTLGAGKSATFNAAAGHVVPSAATTAVTPATAAAPASAAGAPSAAAGAPSAAAGSPSLMGPPVELAGSANAGKVLGAAGSTTAPGAAKAGMTLGEKMMMGSMAMQGVGAYMTGEAEEEALQAERDRLHWYKGDVLAPTPQIAGINNVNSGLMRRPNANVSARNVPMDQVVRQRYNVGGRA